MKKNKKITVIFSYIMLNIEIKIKLHNIKKNYATILKTTYEVWKNYATILKTTYEVWY